MGLDMQVWTMRHVPDKPVDFEAHDHMLLHDWRKHANLHGWMERLYREKGGKARDFNLVGLQLTSADIDALEFIAKARKALAVGLTVFYAAWW
jgi:hypothetical protein